jgi:hypothetical protein
MSEDLSPLDSTIGGVSSYFLEQTPHGPDIDWQSVVEDTLDELPLAIKGDHEALRRVLVAGFPQRRYMTNIDIDRIVKIEAVKPWLEEVIDDYLLEENIPKGIQKRLDAGFDVVTRGELYSFRPTYKVLYKNNALASAGVSVEYHGTSAEYAVQAFPDLDLPPPDTDWRDLWRGKP